MYVIVGLILFFNPVLCRHSITFLYGLIKWLHFDDTFVLPGFSRRPTMSLNVNNEIMSTKISSCVLYPYNKFPTKRLYIFLNRSLLATSTKLGFLSVENILSSCIVYVRIVDVSKKVNPLFFLLKRICTSLLIVYFICPLKI